MEVVLREHVDNLGQRGDIVKVADGYARNYLLPRKLALPATAANKRIVERQQKIFEAREAETRAAAEVQAARLAAVECVLARRVGESETLYGSVTASDVAAALAAQGLAVEKRRVLLHEPIKQLGEFDVPVRLHREVTVTVKVRVVKDEESK